MVFFSSLKKKQCVPKSVVNECPWSTLSGVSVDGAICRRRCVSTGSRMRLPSPFLYCCRVRQCDDCRSVRRDSTRDGCPRRTAALDALLSRPERKPLHRACAACSPPARGEAHFRRGGIRPPRAASSCLPPRIWKARSSLPLCLLPWVVAHSFALRMTTSPVCSCTPWPSQSSPAPRTGRDRSSAMTSRCT